MSIDIYEDLYSDAYGYAGTPPQSLLAQYRREAGVWRPWKYGGFADQDPPVNPDRSLLVAGVDKPGPTNTGPYTVTSFTDAYPVGSANYVSFPNATFPTSPVYGLTIWGQLRVSAPFTFKECRIAGPDPRNYINSDPGCVRCYGANPQRITLEDCVIDPTLWNGVGGRTQAERPGNITGIHGGNVYMYRTEITEVHDGWNFIGPNGQDATAVANQSHLSQQNWYHKGHYVNNYYGPSDGQVHADGIQFNLGRNFTSRGDFIGGARDMTGFMVWPGGYNAGDDFYGSGVQISQEVDSSPNNLLSNIIFEDGWIEGCANGINHAVMPNRPNPYAGSAIRRMKFGHPRLPGWGSSLVGTGPGSTPTLINANSPGYYIIRNSAFAALYTDNVLYDGSPVPITNG